MPDTQDFTPSSGEESVSSPEKASTLSAVAGAEPGSPVPPSQPTVTTNAETTSNAWLSYGLCAVGAVVAVVLGTALFGPDQSLIAKFVVPLFSTLSVGLAFAWHAMTSALAALPWALVFEVIGGFAVFYVCRRGKTREVQNGFYISALTGLGALAVYLMADSPDIDNLLAAAKGLTVSALLSWFAFATAKARKPRHQSGEWEAELCAFLGIVVSVASLVVWVFWASNSQNTYPEITAIVQQKYSTQLATMGFEDVNRNDLSGADGFCSSVDYHFRSGSTYRQNIAPTEGVFDRSLHIDKSTCVSMRFREGHLTAIYPIARATSETTSDELKADAVKSADNLFAEIQKVYEKVQMTNARAARGF